MPFAVVLSVLLVTQAVSAVAYWRRGVARDTSGQLRVVSLVVGIGLILLVSAAWNGLGIDVNACSSLSRPSDVRSSEEHVLGSCLIAASLSVIVAVIARRPRRVVAWLVGVALTATVIAMLYFADHVYRLSCWDE